MKYKLIILLFLITSCSQNFNTQKIKKTFNSKGFAYIYNENDFNNKIIKKKMDNNILQIAHDKLRPGTLIKLINPKTNDSIILKNTKRFEYPEFYKILITRPVANKINLNDKTPFIEVLEIKKNKSFVVEKSIIYKEEKKIHSKAPVELVKIDNISKKSNVKKNIYKDKMYINIAEFYSKESANTLKKRIAKEIKNINVNKLLIKRKETNKYTLLLGPYSSINLIKNDYIHLKNFGFEELDIGINE